ncbi:MAG: nicotinate phosphoribosyltransferase [Leptolyngbyaceae cyanobacterium bins.59]|nr:nicotinate phosphoribosyltransferase [Leptolyngbyaceae cyanobacterium bins.59]
MNTFDRSNSQSDPRSDATDCEGKYPIPESAGASLLPSTTSCATLETIASDAGLTLQPDEYSLLTDLYQLTMAACYTGKGLEQRPASFEVTVRRLPPGFGYLVAMGLAQVLDYLENLHFTSAQVEALKATGIFANVPDAFWSLLTSARFSGDGWAVPEGTIVFANEPLLRIEAPLWQAQLVETYILNALNYQTLVATRSARLRDVAGPTATLLEFGTRRAFSPQASLWAARAALAAGLDATSNVLAALKLGRKPAGTMAHALVMALTATEGSEREAFAAFHETFPGAPLLIDTFDSIAAAESLAEQVRAGTMKLGGVRLDSGDLVNLSQQVRALLPGVPILASGDLDEYKIAELRAAGACIDGYGLGTKLVTGQPVNGVYKLVELDGIPVMKESSGKVTYPGRKQIFRQYENGVVQRDRLGLATEPAHEETPLLKQFFQNGKRIHSAESLETIALRTATSVASLPPEIRSLEGQTSFPVTLSPELQTLIQQTRNTH